MSEASTSGTDNSHHSQPDEGELQGPSGQPTCHPPPRELHHQDDQEEEQEEEEEEGRPVAAAPALCPGLE